MNLYLQSSDKDYLFVITRVTHTQSEWTTDLIYSLATDCPYNSDEDY